MGLSNRGEELLLGLALGVRDPPTELVIGLYDARNETPDDADEFSAIASEPRGAGNYARPTVAWPGEVELRSDGNGMRTLTITIDSEFDVRDVNQEVSGWLLGGTYQAEADDAPTEHLLGWGDLPDPEWPDGSGLPAGAYPLAADTTFTLDAGTAGLTLD